MPYVNMHFHIYMTHISFISLGYSLRTHRDYVLTDPHMNDIMTLNSIKKHALKGQLRNE